MTDSLPGTFPAGLERRAFAHAGVRRDVFQAPLTGPPVIVIHEAGGLNNRTMAVADTLTGAGFSAVLPVLLDTPRPKTSASQLGRNMRTICTAAEFAAFAHDEPAPIATWLRALARDLSDRAGGTRVGVIGMCFSGSFALAMVTEPAVAAAVVSQPALPFPLPGRRTALGMSAEELDAVAARADEGFCVRTLRYQRDFLSPGVRMRFMEEMLPNASIVEMPTWNPFDHSVLVNATKAPADSDLGRALAGTITYLKERLIR